MKRMLLLVLMLTVSGWPSSSRGADQPNIVLFLVDDMGWMDSTPYGSRYYETPNMRRLAKQSMRFTDAYAVPLCSPTRASILSGQYSARHRVTSASGHRPAAPSNASPYPQKAAPNKQFLYARSKNYLDPELTTLAEVLRAAGYRTGHIGKWHLGLNQEHWPDKHGFDVAFHAQPSPGPPSYFSPYGVHKDGKPSGRHHVGTITDGPKGEYITDRLTDEAIDFIEANKARPFFLNFWHYAVHGPWGHKEEYTAEFAKKTDPRGRQRNPIMASMLKSVDESLGRVMDRLDQLGLRENTLLIFYSDNGGNTHSNTPGSRQMRNIKPGHPKWGFVQDWKKWAGPEPPTNNAPLREGKGRIYEGGQRVPLMIRWPGKIEPGSTSDAVVGPIDLYPTILEAVGLETPEDHIVDGESLLPVLQQTGRLERQAYFTWFPHLIPAVSVRQGDWKLIRRFEPHRDYPEVRELYNLKKDLGETHNLAKTMPEKVKELDALIDGFVKESGGPLSQAQSGFPGPARRHFWPCPPAVRTRQNRRGHSRDWLRAAAVPRDGRRKTQGPCHRQVRCSQQGWRERAFAVEDENSREIPEGGANCGLHTLRRQSLAGDHGDLAHPRGSRDYSPLSSGEGIGGGISIDSFHGQKRPCQKLGFFAGETMKGVFHLSGLVAGICWAFHVLSVAPLAAERPNVVLIISDDQTYSDFGFMGHPHVRTPHIDRLAQDAADSLRTSADRKRMAVKQFHPAGQ